MGTIQPYQLHIVPPPLDEELELLELDEELEEELELLELELLELDEELELEVLELDEELVAPFSSQKPSLRSNVVGICG